MEKKPFLQALSESRKKRILKWEIPYLLSLLKKEHGLSFMHLLPSVPLYFEGHLVFEGKTCFPIKGGALGHLLCFKALNRQKARQIRMLLDSHLRLSSASSKKLARPLLFSDKKLSQKNVLREAMPPLVCPDEKLLNVLNKPLKKGALKNRARPLDFPLLLKGKARPELLKTAHDIYLKTPSFAFLNAEDMIWKENVFQELKQVFVCVPSLYALLPFQKQILIKALSQKKLSCYLTVGLCDKESLSEKWRALFASAL